MSAADAVFWREDNPYHDLAERFERNVEVDHPDHLTGRSGYYSCGCARCAREVTYYWYAGPSL